MSGNTRILSELFVTTNELCNLVCKRPGTLKGTNQQPVSSSVGIGKHVILDVEFGPGPIGLTIGKTLGNSLPCAVIYAFYGEDSVAKNVGKIREGDLIIALAGPKESDPWSRCALSLEETTNNIRSYPRPLIMRVLRPWSSVQFPQALKSDSVVRQMANYLLQSPNVVRNLVNVAEIARLTAESEVPEKAQSDLSFLLNSTQVDNESMEKQFCISARAQFVFLSQYRRQSQGGIADRKANVERLIRIHFSRQNTSVAGIQLGDDATTSERNALQTLVKISLNQNVSWNLDTIDPVVDAIERRFEKVYGSFLRSKHAIELPEEVRGLEKHLLWAVQNFIVLEEVSNRLAWRSCLMEYLTRFRQHGIYSVYLEVRSILKSFQELQDEVGVNGAAEQPHNMDRIKVFLVMYRFAAVLEKDCLVDNLPRVKNTFVEAGAILERIKVICGFPSFSLLSNRVEDLILVQRGPFSPPLFVALVNELLETQQRVVSGCLEFLSSPSILGKFLLSPDGKRISRSYLHSINNQIDENLDRLQLGGFKGRDANVGMSVHRDPMGSDSSHAGPWILLVEAGKVFTENKTRTCDGLDSCGEIQLAGDRVAKVDTSAVEEDTVPQSTKQRTQQRKDERQDHFPACKHHLSGASEGAGVSDFEDTQTSVSEEECCSNTEIARAQPKEPPEHPNNVDGKPSAQAIEHTNPKVRTDTRSLDGRNLSSKNTTLHSQQNLSLTNQDRNEACEASLHKAHCLPVLGVLSISAQISETADAESKEPSLKARIIEVHWADSASRISPEQLTRFLPFAVPRWVLSAIQGKPEGQKKMFPFYIPQGSQPLHGVTFLQVEANLGRASGVVLLAQQPLFRSLYSAVREHIECGELRNPQKLVSEEMRRLVLHQVWEHFQGSHKIADESVCLELRQSLSVLHRLPRVITAPFCLSTDLDFELLFRSLSPAQIVSLMSLLLLERKVLFVSKSATLLLMCQEILLRLLSPFSWQHLYIPMLPEPLLGNLECPTPFVIGIQESYAFKRDFPFIVDVTIVDLDVGALRAPTDDPVQLLVGSEALVDTLNKELRPDASQYDDFQSFDGIRTPPVDFYKVSNLVQRHLEWFLVKPLQKCSCKVQDSQGHEVVLVDEAKILHNLDQGSIVQGAFMEQFLRTQMASMFLLA